MSSFFPAFLSSCLPVLFPGNCPKTEDCAAAAWGSPRTADWDVPVIAMERTGDFEESRKGGQPELSGAETSRGASFFPRGDSPGDVFDELL